MQTKIVTSVGVLAAVAALAIGFTGCAGVVANLPAVLAYVQDAELVVSTIESFVNAYFTAKPDPALQGKIAVVIARVKSAEDLIARLATAGKEANMAQIDAAFADLKVAYVDLLQLVGPLGVHASDGARFGAVPGGLVVPTPAVFARQAAAR